MHAILYIYVCDHFHKDATDLGILKGLTRNGLRQIETEIFKDRSPRKVRVKLTNTEM